MADDTNTIIGLSPADQKLLKEMAAQYRNTRGNGPVPYTTELTDTSSSDLYIALPPTTGIPALTSVGTGSVGNEPPQEGDEPGHAECNIYHLTLVGTSDEVQIRRISQFALTVFNLSRRALPYDWTPVIRMKDGHWLAQTSPGSSTSATIYIALPNESQGIPALTGVVVGTASIGVGLPTVGDIPGKGLCQVYKIEDNKIELLGTDIEVYNIFRTPIPRDWFIIGLDAEGKWLALTAPELRNARAVLVNNLNAGWRFSSSTDNYFANAILELPDEFGVWQVTDRAIIVEMPPGYKGIWFAGQVIDVYQDVFGTWYPTSDGYQQFIAEFDTALVDTHGVGSLYGRFKVSSISAPTYSRSNPAYTIAAYIATAGGNTNYQPYLHTPHQIYWDGLFGFFVAQPLIQSYMGCCAYFTWCSSAWQTYDSTVDPNTFGPATGQGIFYAPTAIQAALLVTLNGSGVTGRFTGETVLICSCGCPSVPPTTTTTTSTTTTTTTTPNCCSQMPSSISFELVDSGDCHYSGQVITLTRSGNTWSWSGTVSCGDPLTVTLTCNPAGGGSVSALSLVLTYPCATPSTITGSIPGTCTCAAISSCAATYTDAGDVSACACCTTTGTSTTTTTTTTAAASYACSGNGCGTCVRRWNAAMHSWQIFSTSCSGSCFNCCSPGFDGTTNGELTTVGCCNNVGLPACT